jgi:predicted amidophosphoribosyltransferase
VAELADAQNACSAIFIEGTETLERRQAMTCACGNELSLLTTSCPRCGKTYVGKTAVIVAVFAVALFIFIGVIVTKFG